MRARTRLPAILLAVACVAVATIGLRLTDTEPRRNVEVLAGRFDQVVRIRGGEVRVTAMRFGTALSHDGEVKDRTNGMFVVLTVETSNTGTEQLLLNGTKLLSHDVTYSAYGYGGRLVDPGFRSTSDLSFEVDPEQIDDLTLDIYSAEVIAGYTQHARIRLGVTAATAEPWRASGRGRVVPVAEESRQAIG